MHTKSKLLIAACIALLLAASSAASALDPKDAVLRRLDETSKNFHSTAADFEFDSISTDPIYEKDVQTGTVYYERGAKGFKMSAHIREADGKPVPKTYVYADGVFRLYEQLPNQVTTLTKLSQYESWFMLGFGASGTDLEKKWEIKYLKSETLMEGKKAIKTEVLELTPKDPAVKKNLPKVIVWIDTERGISVKQHFDEGSGQSRDCFYFNIKINGNLPSDAFTFKTDKKTQYINQ